MKIEKETEENKCKRMAKSGKMIKIEEINKNQMGKNR